LREARCGTTSAFAFLTKGTDASLRMSAQEIRFSCPIAGNDARVLAQRAATIARFKDIVSSPFFELEIPSSLRIFNVMFVSINTLLGLSLPCLSMKTLLHGLYSTPDWR
jgi:hypothetical protein